MKVAIIGANGQLGTDLADELSKDYEVFQWNHSDIEITNTESVRPMVQKFRPDVILNTAAYHVVPQAENFPDKAFLINATGALNLAKVCDEQSVRLVHYSTDYVFDGVKNKPYTETDPPNPLSVYGNSKLAGEYFVRNYCPQSF